MHQLSVLLADFHFEAAHLFFHLCRCCKTLQVAKLALQGRKFILLFLKLDLKPSFFLKTLTHIFLKTGTLLDLFHDLLLALLNHDVELLCCAFILLFNFLPLTFPVAILLVTLLRVGFQGILLLLKLGHLNLQLLLLHLHLIADALKLFTVAIRLQESGLKLLLPSFQQRLSLFQILLHAQQLFIVPLLLQGLLQFLATLFQTF
mmetsp:Transcript_24367/g.53106  ORF Transcript_24367/g.53106 Transcript_24367/m.53106 type:complete len:204 (+) Transcript_24367:293-904(+)